MNALRMAALVWRLCSGGDRMRRLRISSAHGVFMLAFVLQLQLHTATAWLSDIRPVLQPKQDKIISKFVGNTTDYFKVLDYDDTTVLVGARDVIYNISLPGLRENNRIEWYSSDADRELCALKGKHEGDCHNYIRVFARLNDGQILLCGTNSYKPRCRNYAPTIANEKTTPASSGVSPAPQYELVRDVEAQGLCPYSPAHNSTYVYADGQLYSATVADFSGGDPLIYRENLRTEQYDLKQLNQPDFVGAVERDGYVLFFFREISMEYMNFGKAIYSRVGRVCKNDRGGPYTLSKSWTSFLKARLRCSVPGEFPFYFDEIQAITPIIENGPNSLVYAVFTTSVNAIPGSAVCAFNIDDIMDAFEGNFKSQKDTHSQWLPIPEDQIPVPRPGKCVDDSRMLASIAVNFVKNHPLMEEEVPPAFKRTLLKVDWHNRFTTIAVDSQIMALDGEFYDVVYIGSDDGKITKFINIPTPSNAGAAVPVDRVVISVMQVLPVGRPVRQLVVSSKTNTLLVVSDGGLVTVPLHHCSHIVDCLSCLSLQDPNCAWDQHNHECKSLTLNNHKFGTKSYLQSLNTTKKAAAALCPRVSAVNDKDGSGNEGIPIITNVPQIPVHGDDEHLLSTKLHYAKVGATLTGIGHAVNEVDPDSAPGPSNDFLTNFNDENKITLPSVDADDLRETHPSHSTAIVGEHKIHVASKTAIWNYFMVALVVFIFGMAVGLYSSNKACKAPSSNANHRNQFPPNTQFMYKSDKDTNLLNSDQSCQKRAQQLGLEKDRSHECKNSTEKLEKELQNKSTLTKVKRTYI